MTKDKDNAGLYEIVGAIYESHSAERIVKPTWLATEAMTTIGADRDLNALWYLAAHLQFRQIARSFCQARFDPTEETDTDDLFPETLQDRYPQAPASDGSESGYVLRGIMSAADRAYNVERMRMVGRALLRHADALEAEGRNRPAAVA